MSELSRREWMKRVGAAGWLALGGGVARRAWAIWRTGQSWGAVPPHIDRAK